VSRELGVGGLEGGQDSGYSNGCSALDVIVEGTVLVTVLFKEPEDTRKSYTGGIRGFIFVPKYSLSTGFPRLSAYSVFAGLSQNNEVRLYCNTHIL
jgi:hypothetical protein